MRRLALGLLALVTVVAALQRSLREDRIPNVESPAEDQARQIEEHFRPAAESTATKRAPMPDSLPAPSTHEQGPVPVEPYAIRVNVVDGAGQAVPQATVGAWDAKRSSLAEAERLPVIPAGVDRYRFETAGDRALVFRTTDERGRCTLELDHEFVLVRATKKSLGDSGFMGLWHTEAKRQPEHTLTLLASVPLSVLVLGIDAKPASAVLVKARRTSSRSGATRVPDPVLTTDREGRCRLDLLHGQTYDVLASKDAHCTLSERVWPTVGAGPSEIVLHFRGSLSVSGTLLDANGWPIQGHVMVWQRPTTWPRPGFFRFVRQVTCTAEGTWRTDLPRTGTFELFGRADGHSASDVATLEITDHGPHARADLRLVSPMTIQGVVTREDGTALEGAALALSSEDPNAGHPFLQDWFGIVPSVASDANGRFVFAAVHPRVTYTLMCTPVPGNSELRVTQTGIAPGTEVRVIVMD